MPAAAAPNEKKIRPELLPVVAKLRELADAGRTDELLALVIDLLTRFQDENSQLAERAKAFARQMYGRKSEKVSMEQLALLFEALGDEAPASAQDCVPVPPIEKLAEDRDPAAAKSPSKRKHGGRSPLPPNLPREVKVVKVPDAERTCPVCGAEKVCIGHAVSEVLEFVPAHFKVVEEQREKLACAQCENGVTTAPSEKVYDRGRPGPGLLAHLVVGKFQDSLPLYRQSQIYKRSGVTLSPSTLGDWCAFALEVLHPLADRIAWWSRRGHYLHADDTGIRVLDRDDPRGVKRGHLWAFVGEETWVAFHYAPDWKAEHPGAFLKHFLGYVQGDGYAGYASAVGPPREEVPVVPEERRLGCGMHIRRKFEAAAEGGDVRAAVALAYFRRLYEIEASCKADGLTPEQRLARRDEQSQPVLADLYQWIDQLHETLVPGTTLRTATTYARNQRGPFLRCFTDGRFEIDNGEVERQLRRVALGRKNYLFAGSESGAVRIAVAYTVLGTCHKHGVDPQAYLTDVITKLQAGWPRSRIDELLPPNWKPDTRA